MWRHKMRHFVFIVALRSVSGLAVCRNSQLSSRLHYLWVLSCICVSLKLYLFRNRYIEVARACVIKFVSGMVKLQLILSNRRFVLRRSFLAGHSWFSSFVLDFVWKKCRDFCDVSRTVEDCFSRISDTPNRRFIGKM